MPLLVTNSLTRKKEEFVPLKSGEVRMYVCGPTVYNLIHIGNARPLVFFDVVARYLTLSGYKVTRVMNYTDVDDKIIKRARDEKTSWEVIANRYIEEFQKDMKLLKVNQPDHFPRVTENIAEIKGIITGLIKNGVAYAAEDGEVFFAVRKFVPYGKLSGKKVDELMIGARIAPDEKKHDPLDFSLWKPQKAPDEPNWESPWGKGRPGWHIECSAMSMRYLGESFDIHGGGMDLIHPHHENEIAQSEGCTGKPYCKYWLHNNMLTFQSEKMSKSLGNISLARDFINKYTAETLKFFLLSGHYRSTLDYSEKSVSDAQLGLLRIYKAIGKCEAVAAQTGLPANPTPSPEEKALLETGASFRTRWRECMDDDFNTPKAFSLVFDYVRAINAYFDKKGLKPNSQSTLIAQKFLEEIRFFSTILNVFGEPTEQYLDQLKDLRLMDRGITREEIKALIEKRLIARAQKDFATSDQIRNDLLAKGIELKDSGTQTDWDVVLN